MPVTIENSQDHNDFRVFFQYVNDEPAMVIGATRFDRRRAFVICLSSAYMYLDDDYLVKQAMTAANVLSLGVDKSTVYRIADAIMSHLDELVKMPPSPEENTQRIIEDAVEKHGLSMKVNDQEILH